jgi:hypothetical protein
MDLIRAGQAVAIPRQADTDDQLIITPDGNWQTSFWQLSYAGRVGNCRTIRRPRAAACVSRHVGCGAQERSVG